MAGNVEIGTVTAYVKLDTRGLKAGIDESKGTMQKFAAALGTSTTQLAKQMGRDMQIAGAAIAGALGLATKQAGDFDQAMRNVNSLAKETETQFAATKKQVLGLVDDPLIRQGPTDLAKGLYDVVSSGFQGEKAMEVMRVAAIGAGAGMTDTATATRILSAVLNSGIGGVNSIRGAMDILFREVDLGVNTFEGLANALGDVLPTAKTAGVSLQEISAALVVMTRRGININEAVTALNQLLNHIIKPGKESAKVMEAFGIENGIAAIQSKGLTGVLDQMMKKLGDNKQAFTELIPEVRGMKALLTLVDEGGRQYTEMLKGMMTAQDGVGASMLAANEQAKGAHAQMEKLRAELERMGVEIGETLLPYLRDLVAKLREMVSWFRGQSDFMKDAEIKIAAFGAATLIAAGSLLRLAGAFNAAKDAFIAARAAGLFTGIGLIGAAAANLSGDTRYLGKTNAEIDAMRAREFEKTNPNFGKPVNVDIDAEQARLRALMPEFTPRLGLWGFGGIGNLFNKSSGGAGPKPGKSDADQADLIKERSREIIQEILKSGQGEIAAQRDKARQQFQTDIETGVKRELAQRALINRMRELDMLELGERKKTEDEWKSFKETLRQRNLTGWDQLLGRENAQALAGGEAVDNMRAMANFARNFSDALGAIKTDRLKPIMEEARAFFREFNDMFRTPMVGKQEHDFRDPYQTMDQNAEGERNLALQERIRREMEKQRDAARQTMEAWAPVRDALQRGFESAFGDMFKHGLKGFKSFFNSILQSFEQTLAQMAAEWAAKQIIFAGIKLAAFAGFDDPVNDATAGRWGRDFGKHFSMGALESASRMAVAGNGAGSVSSGHTYYNFSFPGDIHIREEADISKLADGLAVEIQRRSRVRF